MHLYEPADIKHYRELSGGGNQFRGLSLLPYEKEIGALIASTQSRSLLDYGCGLGHQYKVYRLHEKWGITDLFLYDPGIGTRWQRPSKQYDFVVCSDVMEHVPPHLVDNVLRDLFSFAKKSVWISVCCRPAKKRFPDGRNLHLTIQPPEWWQERIAAAAGDIPFTVVVTE